jgi:GDP-L-fucose synthase
MRKESKILVTGSTGMVGSVLVEKLTQTGFLNLLTPGRIELDLLDFSRVNAYFDKYKPDHVFIIAAKVGGIAANMSDPVGFLQDNLEIELNLFKACFKNKTKKNMFLGSSCIYPKDSPQPMREEYLMTGPLEPTNEGYALSKIVGLRLAEYYYTQYNMITICPMPANIYGTNDHFELDKSHVLSALVKRFVDAKDNELEDVTLWGTGIARREFIHVEDIANALIYFMNSDYEKPDIINIGTGSDVSIQELAVLIKEKVGFNGKLNWDSTKPNGMLKKCMDVSKMISLGFQPTVSLEQGIERTIQEYKKLKQRGKFL